MIYISGHVVNALVRHPSYIEIESDAEEKNNKEEKNCFSKMLFKLNSIENQSLRSDSRPNINFVQFRF